MRRAGAGSYQDPRERGRVGRRGGPSDQLPGSCPCWSVKERQRGHGMTEWAVAMIDGAATLRVLAVFRQQPARWAPWSHPRPSSRTRLSGAGGSGS